MLRPQPSKLRKAMGIPKKRTSDFERAHREFAVTSHGISIVEPLRNLRGVSCGTPEFAESAPLDPSSSDDYGH